MGSKTDADRGTRLYLMTKEGDSEYKRITEVKNFPTEYAETTIETTDLLRLPMKCAFSVSISKFCRCKSRKRFVKLLMATGFHRNAANKLADVYNMLHVPYNAALFDVLVCSFSNISYDIFHSYTRLDGQNVSLYG